jgi:hypothetical protein
MKEGKFQDQLLRRLDVLISLRLDGAAAESTATISDKVRRLVALGLKPAEVAGILRKPVNYVTAILAGAKRARRAK